VQENVRGYNPLPPVETLLGLLFDPVERTKRQRVLKLLDR